jgi:hypothetical protein
MRFPSSWAAEVIATGKVIEHVLATVIGRAMVILVVMVIVI